MSKLEKTKYNAYEEGMYDNITIDEDGNINNLSDSNNSVTVDDKNYNNYKSYYKNLFDARKKNKKNKRKKGNYKVNIFRLNWDAECLKDIRDGNGFLITEPATFTDDSKHKSLYGPRSPLYGTTAEDENAFA